MLQACCLTNWGRCMVLAVGTAFGLHTCVLSEAKRVATRVAPSETTKLSSESSVTPAAC